MTLQEIDAFIAVAETGSINRAALRLHLTQPATTRRIQNFEAAFGGAPLFDRSVRPAVLTARGARVLEQCRAVMASLAQLETLQTRADEPAGAMRIGVAHGLDEMVLTAPLDAIRQRFGQVRLHISSHWSAALIEQVQAGLLDCAVALLTDGHVCPAPLKSIDLGPEAIRVVAPKNLALPQPCRLSDLARQGWVLNPPGCGCRTALSRMFDQAGLALEIAAEVFGEDLQLALLARSGGLGLVPESQFAHSPHRPLLHPVEVLDFRLDARLTLLRSAQAGRLDPVIEGLAAALREKRSHPSSGAFSL